MNNSLRLIGAIVTDRSLGHNFEAYTGDQPTWSKTLADLRLQAWIGRFPQTPSSDTWDYTDVFTDRQIFFCIDCAHEVIAAGELQEWRHNFPPEHVKAPEDSLDTFFYAADAESQAASAFGELLKHVWGPIEEEECENLFDYGTVLLFDRLLIKTRTQAQSNTVWALIDALFAQLKRSNQIAALFLKAFPLEFEGDTKAPQQRIKARQRALQRLYERRLSLTSISDPKEAWVSDWMWRPFRGRSADEILREHCSPKQPKASIIPFPRTRRQSPRRPS
jgi:hypothetical protein